MKKMFNMKRFLSIFLIFLMLGCGISYLVVSLATGTYSSKDSVNRFEGLEQIAHTELNVSNTDTNDLDDLNFFDEKTVTIIVGDKSYKSTDENKPIIDYSENSNISALFEWKVKDEKKIPKQYEYSLGDLKLKEDYKGGLLYNQNNLKIGEWKFVRADTKDGKDKLVFTFENSFQSEYTKERFFWVRFDGTVPLDPPEDENNKKNKFQIGEEWFDMNPQYQKGEVELTKEMGDCKLDEDGNLIYTVNITATIKGYVKELKLIDRLSNGAPVGNEFYSMSDLKVQLNDNDLSQNEDYTNAQLDNPWGFELSFNEKKFNTGDKINVTYTFKMYVSKFRNLEFFPDDNIVNATGKDIPNDGNIKCNPKKSPVNLNSLKLELKKEGERNPDNPNRINWGITVDTGLDAPSNVKKPKNSNEFISVLEYLLRKKYGDLYIKDILSEGHHFIGNNYMDDTGQNIYGFFLHSADFEVNNGKWCLVYKYSTEIHDLNGINEYTNEAIITDGNKTITSSGPIGIPVYTLNKSASGKVPIVNEDGSVTMSWEIVTRIPGSQGNPNFGSFTIVDKPEKDITYNKDYIHQYKEGTIKVYISDNDKYDKYDVRIWDGVLSNKPDWLAFTKNSDGGFTLTINYTSEIRQYQNEYLIIVYDTEVVDELGHNVNFTNNDYKWGNTAEIEGKNLKDSSEYSQVAKTPATPTIAKSVLKNNDNTYYEKEEGTGDYIFTWFVRVSNFPSITKSWEEKWEDIYSMDLVDTLPEGHVFEKDSLVATLYRGSTSAVSIESIPTISNWLSNNLKYEEMEDMENGQKRVKIIWNTPKGQRPDLEELKKIYDDSKDNFYLALQYKTRLVDYSQLFKEKNTNVSFKNTIGGTVNDNSVQNKTVNATVKPESFGVKSYDYQRDWVSSDAKYSGEEDWMYTVDEKGISTPNMRFTIEINQLGLKANSKDSGIVYLEDTMGIKLRLLEDSVRLFNTVTQKYEDVSFKYDNTENKLTMKVPGGTHYTLTYWVEVRGDIDSKLDKNMHGNSVRFTLEGKEASYVNNPSGSKYGSVAGAQATFTSSFLPRTGGPGIYIFYILGSVLVLTAGIFIFIVYRKNRT